MPRLRFATAERARLVLGVAIVGTRYVPARAVRQAGWARDDGEMRVKWRLLVIVSDESPSSQGALCTRSVRLCCLDPASEMRERQQVLMRRRDQPSSSRSAHVGGTPLGRKPRRAHAPWGMGIGMEDSSNRRGYRADLARCPEALLPTPRVQSVCGHLRSPAVSSFPDFHVERHALVSVGLAWASACWFLRVSSEWHSCPPVSCLYFVGIRAREGIRVAVFAFMCVHGGMRRLFALQGHPCHGFGHATSSRESLTSALQMSGHELE